MRTDVLKPQEIFYKVVRYEVPAFQRRYIWTKENQWEPLWEDVSEKAIAIIEDGKATGHFMGAIVLQQRPTPTSRIETRVVVDGQQRLTTLQLLIDAVQEVCEQLGYSRSAGRLSRLVLNEKDYLGGNPEFAFKVWPTINDRVVFQQVMRNDLPNEEYQNSNIVGAHNYFKDMAKQWLESYPEVNYQRERAAEALERAVCEHLELVVIDLGDSEDPNVIFETLNARGTPLLPSDMIKNKILHEAGIRVDEDEESSPEEADRLWGFNEDWWRQEIGRGHQRRPRIDIYLNNWLTLRNNLEIKAHHEFAAFNDYAEGVGKNGTSIQSVAADIGRLADIYRDIDLLRLSAIEPFLYRRQVIGVGVDIPVLLWLLSSDVPGPQLSKSITALESFMVRRLARGMSARSYGRLFVGLIEELRASGPSVAGDTVVQYLARQTANADRWPNDQDFLDAFLTLPLYSSLTRGRLNLILQGIEGELRTAMSETQAVPRNLHIEHIMPQGWQIHWQLPNDTEDRERATSRRNNLIHSIGNLTLVNQRLNAGLSNAPWDQKRETLGRHSVLFLNKTLIENAPQVWDESTIAERATKLHQAAIKVWPHATAF